MSDSSLVTPVVLMLSPFIAIALGGHVEVPLAGIGCFPEPLCFVDASGYQRLRGTLGYVIRMLGHCNRSDIPHL